MEGESNEDNNISIHQVMVLGEDTNTETVYINGLNSVCWSFPRNFAIEVINTPIVASSFTTFDNVFLILTIKVSKIFGTVKEIQLQGSMDETTTFTGTENQYWSILSDLDDCYSYYQFVCPWSEYYFAFKGGTFFFW